MNTPITNFSKERYISESYLADEWESLWTKTWLLAGMVQDVKESGDYFVFEMGKESILVARADDGEIYAHYNVCQHRGNKIVRDQCGKAKSFTCEYHCWSYDAKGALRSVPDSHRFSNGIPKDDLKLKRLKLEIWHGLIFVSMNDDVAPLSEFFGEITDILAPYRFQDMLVVSDQTVHMKCNWKAMIDNFSELYHVDFIHPQHARFVDCMNATNIMYEHGHTLVKINGGTVNPRYPIPDEPTDIITGQLLALDLDPKDFHGKVSEVRRAIQVRKREIAPSKGYDFSAFSDEQLSDIWQYNLFPNLIFAFTPESLWIMRARPHPTNPNVALFDKWDFALYPDPELMEEAPAEEGGDHARPFVIGGMSAESYTRPEHDEYHYIEVIEGRKSMNITIDQDISLLEDIQEAMQSKGFSNVWLSDDEERIQHFHNEVARVVGRA